MPQEMMIALRIIFALFLLMIARTVWLLIKEKKKEHKYINQVKNMKGGSVYGEKVF